MRLASGRERGPRPHFLQAAIPSFPCFFPSAAHATGLPRPTVNNSGVVVSVEEDVLGKLCKLSCDQTTVLKIDELSTRRLRNSPDPSEAIQELLGFCTHLWGMKLFSTVARNRLLFELSEAALRTHDVGH